MLNGTKDSLIVRLKWKAIFHVSENEKSSNSNSKNVDGEKNKRVIIVRKYMVVTLMKNFVVQKEK